MEDDWYNDDPVSGIVLTETEIFVMDQGKLDYIIEYAEEMFNLLMDIKERIEG